MQSFGCSMLRRNWLARKERLKKRKKKFKKLLIFSLGKTTQNRWSVSKMLRKKPLSRLC